MKISIAIFCSILFIGSLLTVLQGEIPWPMIWQGIKHRLHGGNEWNALLDERFPRLLVLFCTGASLAVSGAVMQSLFQNPLASPSVLGMGAGGSLLVLFIFLFNWQFFYPYTLPLAAFIGCLMTLCVVYFFSRFQSGPQLNNLILTGIATSTILMALQNVILYALRHQWQLIQTITEWEAGSTLDKNWQHVHMQLPLTLIGLWGCLNYRKEMNILSLGEEEAKNLGVDVQKIRWRLFLSVSLLTGAALAAVGVIAFFGLILPHILRRLHGPNNETLIPLCVLGGSSTLIGLDLLLRFFHIQSTISIGSFSSIIGGFFFLFLLFRPFRQSYFFKGS